jgi:hypothetical protein
LRASIAALTMIVASTGCVHTLHLRSDLTAPLPAPNLEGMKVVVAAVKDTRPDPSQVGRHRDGLARVRQWGWAPTPSLDVAAKAMLEHALRSSGASVVSNDEWKLKFDLELVEADVTDDGFFAGMETFGRVQVRLTVTARDGKVISDRLQPLEFADPHDEDPELLGDALYRLLVAEVGRVSPAGAPSI